MKDMIRTIALIVTPLTLQGYEGVELMKQALKDLEVPDEINMNDPLVKAMAVEYINGAIEGVEVAKDVAKEARNEFVQKSFVKAVESLVLDNKNRRLAQELDTLAKIAISARA